jgi:hypothetical protein
MGGGVTESPAPCESGPTPGTPQRLQAGLVGL